MSAAHGKVIGGMAISMDGFIADKDGSVAKLYPDMDMLHDSAYLKDSIRNTGAVVMGRHAYDMAKGDFTGYEYQVPIFVVTHHAPEPPKGQNGQLQIRFVPEGVAAALTKAKAAAGSKAVTVIGGASTLRQCLDAGLLDELHLLMVPILLGGGLRLFETHDGVLSAFEQIGTESFAGLTVLKYRPRNKADHAPGNRQVQRSVMPDASGYIGANDLKMYYEVFGTGQPLILLHGGSATSRSWYEYIPSYAEHFQTIALDSRGHGKTDNPAEVLRYSLMADDVAAFIRAMGLHAPLVLGFSDGAQIALELGLRHPGLARALVLGGAFYRFSEQYRRGLAEYGIEEADENGPARIREVPEEWAKDLRREHVREGEPDYWKRLMQQIAALWSTPLNYTAEDFTKVSVPTLIVSGDREESSEIEQAVEMYRMIAQSELFIVPNAGHMQSAAQMANRFVIEFLLRNSASD